MSQARRFLFDECLGKPAMNSLQALLPDGPIFQHICDIYGQGKCDGEWIPELAATGGWIVISGDRGKQSGIKPKLPILCAEHGVTHVLLSKTVHNMKSHEKVAAIMFVWSKVEAAFDDPPGTRFHLRVRVSKQTGSRAIVLEKDATP